MIRGGGIPIVGLLLGLGCDPFGTNYSYEYTFKNQGRICLLPADGPQSPPVGPQTQPLDYRVNQPLNLVITMPDCLSSSCSHDEKAACKASVNGNLVDVESTASYRQEGTRCTSDCGLLIARCATAPLPPGNYQIRHGTTMLALTVPSTVPAPCGGRGMGGS